MSPHRFLLLLAAASASPALAGVPDLAVSDLKTSWQGSQLVIAFQVVKRNAPAGWGALGTWRLYAFAPGVFSRVSGRQVPKGWEASRAAWLARHGRLLRSVRLGPFMGSRGYGTRLAAGVRPGQTLMVWIAAPGERNHDNNHAAIRIPPPDGARDLILKEFAILRAGEKAILVYEVESTFDRPMFVRFELRPAGSAGPPVWKGREHLKPGSTRRRVLIDAAVRIGSNVSLVIDPPSPGARRGAVPESDDAGNNEKTTVVRRKFGGGVAPVTAPIDPDTTGELVLQAFRATRTSGGLKIDYVIVNGFPRKIKVHAALYFLRFPDRWREWVARCPNGWSPHVQKLLAAPRPWNAHIDLAPGRNAGSLNVAFRPAAGAHLVLWLDPPSATWERGMFREKVEVANNLRATRVKGP